MSPEIFVCLIFPVLRIDWFSEGIQWIFVKWINIFGPKLNVKSKLITTLTLHKSDEGKHADGLFFFCWCLASYYKGMYSLVIGR